MLDWVRRSVWARLFYRYACENAWRVIDRQRARIAAQADTIQELHRRLAAYEDES